jgi:hypothetical protein
MDILKKVNLTFILTIIIRIYNMQNGLTGK